MAENAASSVVKRGPPSSSWSQSIRGYVSFAFPILALMALFWTVAVWIAHHGYYFLLYHGALSSGWMSGSLHAITGSDHLASILPVILSQRWQAGLMYGLVWGFGHGLTSFVLGVTALGMKSMVISPSSSTSLFLHKYRYFGDFVSAATILIIGLMGLYENASASSDSNEERPSNPSPDDEISLSDGSTRTTDDGSSKKKNVSTKYTAVCYDSVKLVSVFVHGAALGLSLDGLPSLTPAVVLASNHVLVFLSSYWLSTAVIMGIASALVAEVSRFLTKRSKQRHLDSLPQPDADIEAVSGRSTSSLASESPFEEPEYENRLARVASWAACLIGFGYLALSLTRLYLQIYFASFSLIELEEEHPYPFYWMQVLSVPMTTTVPSNDGLPMMNDGTGGVSTAATLMSGFVDDATAHHLEYHQAHGIPMVDIIWTVFSLISVVVALVKGLGSDVIYSIVVHGSSRKYANQQ